MLHLGSRRGVSAKVCPAVIQYFCTIRASVYAHKPTHLFRSFTFFYFYVVCLSVRECV